MLLLVLGIAIAGIVITEIKNEIVGKAEAQQTGGNTLYVGGSGANNYTKIQDAIDDANDGDTVYVVNGAYYENVVVNKRVNLVGEDRNGTIIDGGGIGDVVKITADGITIQGFTIRNSGGWQFAGVKIYYANNNSIYNCNISNNYVGIGLGGSNNSIYNCNIISNNGDGIHAYYSNNNSIYNCNISNNSWYGIGLRYSSNNSIYNCNITSNNRYGIWLYSSYN
ncbi:MAG: right-handed parallel beta-helix repeat-containing protein, partial [Thermoplasmata archaeon]|nr:right-handed parallel beta-helix repeat-containing protein [Thermoplasmata archaeon]